MRQDTEEKNKSRLLKFCALQVLMTIPLERAALPVELKEVLSDLDELLFPLASFEKLVAACKQCGLPEEEAHNFIMDNVCEKCPLPPTILDVCGQSCSGKTYYCHVLASEYIRTDRFCIYMDCEGSFSPYRLQQLIGNHDHDKLRVYRLHDWRQLMPTIVLIRELDLGGLLVIDSLSFLLRNHCDHKLLTSLVHVLETMNNYVILLVNQTTTAECGNLVPSLGRSYRKLLQNIADHVFLQNSYM